FRSNDTPHDYGWEERWVREEGYLKLVPAAADAVLRKAGIAAGDVTRLVLPSPLARIEGAVAKRLGVPDSAVTDGLASRLGYAGAAHGLVQLALALESAAPGDRILLLAFGNGCDALLFEVTPHIVDFRPRRGVGAWLDAGKSTDDYLR